MINYFVSYEKIAGGIKNLGRGTVNYHKPVTNFKDVDALEKIVADVWEEMTGERPTRILITNWCRYEKEPTTLTSLINDD